MFKAESRWKGWDFAPILVNADVFVYREKPLVTSDSLRQLAVVCMAFALCHRAQALEKCRANNEIVCNTAQPLFIIGFIRGGNNEGGITLISH